MFAAPRRFELKHLHFDDDIFGVSPLYIGDLSEPIWIQAPGTTWSCEQPPKRYRDRTIASMVRAGWQGFQVNIEYGSIDMLRQLPFPRLGLWKRRQRAGGADQGR